MLTRLRSLPAWLPGISLRRNPLSQFCYTEPYSASVVRGRRTETPRAAGSAERKRRWKRMCDEHALYDAALREGMVGRTLTLERARQLNSRSYFYEMLKDNPALRAIKPGMEDEYLVGAIDHHIHAFPDFVPRSQDMLQIAVEASRAKMRAIAFKDHWNLTAGSAYLVQRQIDEMVADGRLEHRIEVYGGLRAEPRHHPRSGPDRASVPQLPVHLVPDVQVVRVGAVRRAQPERGRLRAAGQRRRHRPARGPRGDGARRRSERGRRAGPYPLLGTAAAGHPRRRTRGPHRGGSPAAGAQQAANRGDGAARGAG